MSLTTSQTIIGANPWVIHRQKEIFGADCDLFRPERWLEGDRSQMGMQVYSTMYTRLTHLQTAISSLLAAGHARASGEVRFLRARDQI